MDSTSMLRSLLASPWNVLNPSLANLGLFRVRLNGGRFVDVLVAGDVPGFASMG
jgi:hypothetical protein